MKFTIFGKASDQIYKEWYVEPNEGPDENMSLMQYLIEHKIPVASTCLGKGVCQKCMVNENILSCQVTLRDVYRMFPDPEKTGIMITINYL